MNIKRNLLWLAVVANLNPAAGLAADEFGDDFGFEDETTTAPEFYSNYYEIGLGTVSDDNGKLGEFSPDLEDEGLFGVGAVHLDNGNLNLDIDKTPYNTSGEAGYTLPGNFSAKLYGYDSQKIEKFDALTIYPNTGSASSLSIPDGLSPMFIPGSRGGWAGDYSDLSLYGTRTYKVERETLGVELTKYIGTNLWVTADYSHQTKEGTKTQGNHDNDAILPINVDYEHDQFTLGLQYKQGNLSLGANYYLSEFKDNNSFIAFESYTGNGATPDIDVEHIATEPDSTFNRFETDGMYRAGDRTVLSWMANWSKAEQDEVIVGSSPSGKFDGKINRFNGRITLTSRPTRNFDYKLEYTLKDREADHDPLDLGPIGYTSRDSSTFDKNQETFKAQGGYRLPDRSKLRFGWDRDNIERDRYSTVDWAGEYAHTYDESEEDTFWVDYRFKPIGKLNLSLKAERSERDGDQTQHPEWITPYYQDRDRDRYSLNASFPLGDSVVLSGGYTTTDEDYDSGDWEALDGTSSRGSGGLISREWDSTNVEVSFSPNRDLALAIYAMWQSFEWSAFATDQWGQYNADEDVNVYGVNLNWQATTKFNLEADFAISDAESAIASLTDSAPDSTTDSTRLNLKASWQYDPKTSIYARAIYEEWDVNDWANDGTLYEDIAFGWDANDGKNHAFIIGVRRNF